MPHLDFEPEEGGSMFYFEISVTSHIFSGFMALLV
jgi:hypothetical protein